MPTPIEILMDPLSLILIGLYASFMLAEAIAPGRALPVVPGWKTRGLASFAFYFFLSSYLPLFTDATLASYQVMDLGHLGLWAGVVAVVVYEGGVYFWHRAMHGSNALWRAFHQMHHSAERMDTYGAFYFSPLDMVGWTVLGSLSTVWLLGMTPQAATFYMMATFLLGVFQHTNIKTPRWLGYFVQRPESHTIHHAKGIHDRNFSDLPVFDLLFGTFENPKDYVHETGFYPGASSRVAEMLAFKDVGTPREPVAEPNAEPLYRTA